MQTYKKCNKLLYTIKKIANLVITLFPVRNFRDYLLSDNQFIHFGYIIILIVALAHSLNITEILTRNSSWTCLLSGCSRRRVVIIKGR